MKTTAEDHLKAMEILSKHVQANEASIRGGLELQNYSAKTSEVTEELLRHSRAIDPNVNAS